MTNLIGNNGLRQRRRRDRRLKCTGHQTLVFNNSPVSNNPELSLGRSAPAAVPSTPKTGR